MVHVETTTSMKIVPLDQFHKLYECIRYLEEENALTKVENAMLVVQLHDVYEKSDDAGNNDIKGKTKGEDKEEDKESEVHRTCRYGF